MHRGYSARNMLLSAAKRVPRANDLISSLAFLSRTDRSLLTITSTRPSTGESSQPSPRHTHCTCASRPFCCIRNACRCRSSTSSTSSNPYSTFARDSSLNPGKMTEYKLTDISSLSQIPPFEKLESAVEGVENGRVLVVHGDNNNFHAISPRCTHYGAPLKLGVVAPGGRITCPWHGACFNITTGEIEDAPAPNALHTFPVYEKNGAVYIRGEESAIKAGQRDPNMSCSVTTADRVVVVGGGSGSFGVVQTLRELKFGGSITLISKEPNLPLDRTKLSKALITDKSAIEIRPAEWYKKASIDVVSDEVTGVDFASKTVQTKSGQTYPYTKLVLATGGTPRNLPLEGFQLGNIFLLRFITDAQAIVNALGDRKKKVVVIGSSFIGMEIGINLAGKGHEVSIVGQEQAPLERIMGVQVGRIFQKNLEKSGVRFYLNTALSKATPSANDPSKVGAVHLKDGTALETDLVVVGVGVRPATDFLRGNPAIKLEADGSLRTDESFKVTGLDDVYAIGDIATYPYHGPGTDPGSGTPVRIEHWNVAQNAGRSVARSIVHSLSASGDQPHKPKAFIPVFWSALGMQLRYCGNTTGGWDDLVLRGDPDNAKFAAFYCQGQTVVAVATMQMDPLMTKCAELMRRGRMPSKKEIEEGVDILKLDVPNRIAM